MSEYGEGSPPPPYGGGNSEGQQGQQPYGTPPQPYGTPPAQPYGSPPPQPQYGAPQPPQYGAPAPPPPYGAPPPPYGAAPAAPMGYPVPYGAPMGAAGMPAPMGKRFGARLIDVILVIIVMSVVGAVFFGGVTASAEIDPATGLPKTGMGPLIAASLGRMLVTVVLIALYETIMVALRGQTVGKMALGIKVVREADGGLPGWGSAFLRYLIQQVGYFFCGIGLLVVWLSPFFDNQRHQGWHDKVAKTLVVQA